MRKLSAFYLILMTLSVFFLSSCTTFPEPSEKNSVLVIGKIKEVGANFIAYSGASVNGTNLNNIEVSIKNLSTNKTIKLISNGDGIFSSVNMDPGEYEITKFYIRVESAGAWADLRTTVNADRFFTVKEHAVNNLGGIEWICDHKNGYHYWLNKEYDDVKSKFLSTNPQSKWNDENWEEIKFHR